MRVVINVVVVVIGVLVVLLLVVVVVVVETEKCLYQCQSYYQVFRSINL